MSTINNGKTAPLRTANTAATLNPSQTQTDLSTTATDFSVITEKNKKHKGAPNLGTKTFVEEDLGDALEARAESETNLEESTAAANEKKKKKKKNKHKKRANQQQQPSTNEAAGPSNANEHYSGRAQSRTRTAQAAEEQDFTPLKEKIG